MPRDPEQTILWRAVMWAAGLYVVGLLAIDALELLCDPNIVVPWGAWK